MNFSLDITKILLIILILSILGLNIFNYLAQLSDVAGDVTKTAVSSTLEGTRKTVDLATKGTQAGASVAGGLLSGTIEEIEKVLDIKVEDKSNVNGPSSDDSSSGIQMPKKSGYCYIGEDKGYRQCAYVGKQDTCMSGDVFPSMEICINPNLRA